MKTISCLIALSLTVRSSLGAAASYSSTIPQISEAPVGPPVVQSTLMATATAFNPSSTCGPKRSCGSCPKGFDEQRFLDGKGYLCESNQCECRQATFSKDVCDSCPGGWYTPSILSGKALQGFCGNGNEPSEYDSLCQSGLKDKSCNDVCIGGGGPEPEVKFDYYIAKDVYYAKDGQAFCEDSGKGARRWTDRRCSPPENKAGGPG